MAKLSCAFLPLLVVKRFEIAVASDAVTVLVLQLEDVLISVYNVEPKIDSAAD